MDALAKVRILRWVVPALLVTWAAAAAVIKDVGNEQNVLATVLEGKWVPDESLNKRLGHKPMDGSLEFRLDPEAVPDKILGKLPDEFSGSIYAIGWVTMREGAKETKFSFFLTNLNGNPHIVCFQERGGDPYGDSESSIVMAARGADKGDDLLFMGGDFNNENFMAFRRAK